ncbi:YggT family protein [Zymomonas mobilis]|uniref:YggT family protein n=1 Tax=Zymomonas mobilis subsp. pomaceae (strain ATCC 29192 / DSM 22645 / JCM 10191 / CCUG 17912 / NBRC 13757 / NCIMB 11200 / NRRL B-4491 / Barker I) TaxID=579138 RepID=F8ESC0_ZYMMT|nr:YggT family protein [Zymomonas mobilis]AEI37695.1 protein of unknown function YGGT [Zymomonas mobilis subsp. pomaceae ATCC 29192]MDX5949062.1 YggT family protein [Zymomonas mobilis subsp. pomaceae]GEB88867.1 membrane protein [Zymomonas mobilis subsp. pomaceae]
MILLLEIVYFILNILWWVILIQALASWLIAFNVINSDNDFIRKLLYTLDQITEPLYRPIRKILPDFGAIDLSPAVVLMVILIVNRFVIPHLITHIYMMPFHGFMYGDV